MCNICPIIVYIQTEPLSVTDPNSHSNPEECLVTHISLIWDVDFGRTVLSGCVELMVEKQTPMADKLVRQEEPNTDLTI